MARNTRLRHVIFYIKKRIPDICFRSLSPYHHTVMITHSSVNQLLPPPYLPPLAPLQCTTFLTVTTKHSGGKTLSLLKKSERKRPHKSRNTVLSKQKTIGICHRVRGGAKSVHIKSCYCNTVFDINRSVSFI